MKNGATNKKIEQNWVDWFTIIVKKIALILIYTLKIDVQTSINHDLINQNAFVEIRLHKEDYENCPLKFKNAKAKVAAKKLDGLKITRI